MISDVEPPSYSSLHAGDNADDSQPFDGQESTTSAADSTTLPSGDVKFEITVSDPVKQGEGVNFHVSYRLSTSTNLPQYRWSEFSVIRRFSDFVWLRQRLMDRNPGCIIPPLPEKGVSTKVFTLTGEFIEARRRALAIFMNRVAQHPTLCFSSDLQFFLEANEEAWAEQKAQTSAEGGSAPQPFFKRMFKELSTSATIAMQGSGAGEGRQPEDPVHVKMREYHTHLEMHLADAKRQTERLLKKQRDLATSMSDFGRAMASLGECEIDSLRPAFVRAGQCSEEVAQSTAGQADAFAEACETPMKDATRYIVKGVQPALQARTDAWNKQETLRIMGQSKQNQLNKLNASKAKGSKTVEGQIGECERSLEDIKRNTEQAGEEHTHISEVLAKELRRFQFDRTSDIKKILKEFALNQARHAKRSAAAWQAIIPDLDAAQPECPPILLKRPMPPPPPTSFSEMSTGSAPAPPITSASQGSAAPSAPPPGLDEPAAVAATPEDNPFNHE